MSPTILGRTGVRSDPVRVLRMLMGLVALWPATLCAGMLWSDVDRRVIHQTPVGDDILGGALARNDEASDALYFRFQVDPLSDAADEEYYAAFQLAEADQNRLAVGNTPEAWGYSAFNTSETGPENKVAG